MTRRRPLVRAAAIVTVASLAAPGLPACGGDCADIGCVQNVTVTPDEPITGDGDYEIDFDAGSKHFHCTLTLPGTAPAHCSDVRAYVQHDKKSIQWLSLDTDTKTLHVAITRDGAPVADQTFAVDYTGSSLNGIGCGACFAAEVTLTTGTTPPDAGAPRTDGGAPRTDGGS